MSEQEKINLSKRLEEGILEAQRRLFERKAKLGEPVVVADDKGQPCLITDEEALRRFHEYMAKRQYQ